MASENRDVGVDQLKLELLETQERNRRNLPHLYGWKNYDWMRAFKECTHRTALLTAANQIGKSSCQISKMIDWATNVDIWPALWPGRTPRIFWYLYPDKDTATAEFDEKWVPDFMPRNEMKDHAIYGWTEKRNNKGQIVFVRFNSGVTIYFKTYSQSVKNLQTSSVHYVACDEELPEELWNEVNFRRNAVDGYFSMVFTATLAQEFWRRAMEPTPDEVASGKELFPEAWKRQVSIFDCRRYEDGTSSHWTEEKIKRTVALCSSEAEVLKRIYGRFVADKGRKYPSFERTKNVVPVFGIPKGWYHYAGVDIGGGGPVNHPPAISFIAVKPDFSFGVVYKHWRGDEELTTQPEIVNKYIQMRGHTQISGAWYDYAAKDFKTVSDRLSLGFQPAEKGHDVGEKILNALFKAKMLCVFDTEECEPVVLEFLALLKETDKRKAKDDSADSVRYGSVKIPWDWTQLEEPPEDLVVRREKKLTPCEQADVERNADRDRMFKRDDADEWNDIFADAIADYEDMDV